MCTAHRPAQNKSVLFSTELRLLSNGLLDAQQFGPEMMGVRSANITDQRHEDMHVRTLIQMPVFCEKFIEYLRVSRSILAIILSIRKTIQF